MYLFNLKDIQGGKDRKERDGVRYSDREQESDDRLREREREREKVRRG